ncbi:MAG: DUF86 domain-containing protein [Coriobacteriia bacterium]|nr:DUF86 domain-containing protein [Coriobacteriia bacterium]
MPRDARAYLADIVDSCGAITLAMDGIDLDAYRSNRLIRSAVEREFTIIGEAVSVLSSKSPEVFTSITHARRIVDFRNQLTHEYPNVNDVLVWGIADRDVPVLRRECAALIEKLDDTNESA